MVSAPALFRSVDVAVFVAALTGKLRDAGVDVCLTATDRFGQALQVCPPSSTSSLYWLARTSLIHDREDFPIFDEVFAAVFDSDGLPIAPWERTTPRATAKMTGTVLRHSGPTDGFSIASGRVDSGRTPEVVENDEAADQREDHEDTAEVHERFPAALAEFVDTPFDQLTNEDLDLIGGWLADALVTFPQRRSRRFTAAHRGAIDLRRTLAAARATGGEPVVLARRRPRLRPRRVVMVADVSGSMESFTRIYLHLMRALVLTEHAEVFTFASSLRRVTAQLRDRDPQAAIDRLSDEVADKFGGTRISASIGELTRSPVWAHAVRGSTVLIASDGWDTDPAEHLDAEMQRLARMAHRVVWVNPRSAGDGYEPLVAGMAAALPHTDAFLSGHSLSAMHRVIDALARAPRS